MSEHEEKYEPVKKVVDEIEMCCGWKRCPRVRVYEDGSVDMTDDDQRIEFNPDQARGLLDMLKKSIASSSGS